MADNLMAASAAHIDLTPLSAQNWVDPGPVLLISEQATLHGRIALAWSMAEEMASMTELFMHSTSDFAHLAEVLWPRMEQLTRLLSHLGVVTRPNPTPNPNQGA